MPERELDSVGKARSTMGDGRAFEVLWQAQQYWLSMDTFYTSPTNYFFSPQNS